jgi:hypothetical protein
MEAPSSYFMKSPPKQVTDEEAREQTEEYVRKYTTKPTVEKRKTVEKKR